MNTLKGNCPYCGNEVGFVPSPFYSNERRQCAYCKKLVYVDRDLIEYDKIARGKNERVSERSRKK